MAAGRGSRWRGTLVSIVEGVNLVQRAAYGDKYSSTQTSKGKLYLIYLIE